MPNKSSTLRHKLVEELKQKGVIRSNMVEAAMLAIPREHFAPWLSL